MLNADINVIEGNIINVFTDITHTNSATLRFPIS